MKNEEIIDYLMSTGLYENTYVDMFYEKKMLVFLYICYNIKD